MADFAPEPQWSTVTVKPQHRRSRMVEVEGARFMVGVAEIESSNGQRSWWGKLEGNPARVGDADGFELLDPAELSERLAPVFELVTGDLVSCAEPFEQSRVKRLDVARDFDGVRDVPSLLVGLATVHRPWSRKNNLYNDGTRNGAQTLMVGSGAGAVRLYDKYVETAGGAPEGRLRWEVEARSQWCAKYGGVVRLEDVSTLTSAALASDRWEWSAMGTEVCTRKEVVARLMASGLKPAQRRAFLGWMVETSSGFESSMGSATHAKYRALARDLGVALAPDMFEGEIMGRLDWESGEIVMRAA